MPGGHRMTRPRTRAGAAQATRDAIERAAEAAQDDASALPLPAAPRYAELADVERLADEWAPGVLACRDTGHQWGDSQAVHVVRFGYWKISQRCPRCGCTRYREMSERGHVYASTIEYSEGYLAVGLGRIAGNTKDAVRIAAVRRTYAVTTNRRRNDDEAAPRYSATRHGLEDNGNAPS